jgi:hypothetical protein
VKPRFALKAKQKVGRKLPPQAAQLKYVNFMHCWFSSLYGLVCFCGETEPFIFVLHSIRERTNAKKIGKNHLRIL